MVSGTVDALDVAFWGEYDALMEALRKGEKKSLERWGRGATAHDRQESEAMRQLRWGVEALWVGFGSDE